MFGVEQGDGGGVAESVEDVFVEQELAFVIERDERDSFNRRLSENEIIENFSRKKAQKAQNSI